MCSIFGNKIDQQIPPFLENNNKISMTDDNADKNNNSNTTDEDKSSSSKLADEDEEEESILSNDDVENLEDDLVLDLSQKEHTPPAGHVTLEALQHTKVAVAQFAATAIANSQNYEDAIQDLAAVHSTLFSLQHQQLMQIQLIHQLQSQLNKNNENSQKFDLDEDKFSSTAENKSEEDSSDELDDKSEYLRKNSLEDNLKVRLKEIEENIDIVTKDNKSDLIDAKSHQSADIKVVEKKPCSVDVDIIENEKKNENKPIDPVFQSPLCHISSSLASSIITNHDPPPPPNELNSLEMLQKRTQEVLDSASQSLLASNLAEELAFRRDSCSQDGSKGEGFFKHRCRYCGKIFGSDSALQIHIRSHTGERPFVCNVCGSKFTTKGNLKVHYQRHTQRFPDFPIISNGCTNPNENYNTHPAMMRHNSITTIPPPMIPPRPHGPHMNGHVNMTFSPYGPMPSFHPNINSPTPSHNQNNLDVVEKTTSSQIQEEPADLSKPNKILRSEERNLDFQKAEEIPKPDAIMAPIMLEEECADSKISDQDREDKSEELLIKTPSRRSSISRNASTPDFFPSERIPNILDGNDSSWEDLIEIDKTSETSKLQQLVDNIENKLTDPNQCIFCQKVMSCRSSLQMHLRTHTGERPYRCRICGRAFATKGNLKAHMTIHKIKPPIRSQFKCPVCHQKFSNSMVLQQHIRIHTTDINGGSSNYDRFELDVARQLSEGRSSVPTSEYSGQRSSGSSGTQDDFDDFTLDSDGEEILNQNEENKTELSRKIFKKKVNFDDEIEEALDLTPKKNIVENSSALQLELLSQISQLAKLPKENILPTGNRIRKELELDGEQKQDSTSPSSCNNSLKTFTFPSEVDELEAPFKCDTCDEEFLSKEILKQHEKLHKFNQTDHQDSNDSNSENSNCDLQKDEKRLLNSSFNEKNSLSPLSLQNENNNPIKLLQVKDFAFNNFEKSENESGSKKSKYDIDMVKRHTSDLEYKILAPNRAIDHMSQPSLPPPLTQMHSLSMFRGESFHNQLQQQQQQQHQQQQHQSLPLGASQLDQPINTKHLCTICRRNFSSSSALQIHMRTHTGDKPFRCTVCQKAFTTKGNLKVHMGTHMWTNGSSRRGRRMSLELPTMQRPPISIGSHDPEFLQRRAEMFYPYLPPFLNGGLQAKNQSTPFQNLPPFHPGLANKFLGFNPFGPRLQNLGPPHMHLSNFSPPLGDKSNRNNNASPSSEESDKLNSVELSGKNNLWNSSRHERSQSCGTEKSFESINDDLPTLQSSPNKCSEELKA